MTKKIKDGKPWKGPATNPHPKPKRTLADLGHATREVKAPRTRKPKPKLKVVIKGGDWVDALQEAVEAHKGSTLIRVSTHWGRRSRKAKPWVDFEPAPVIKRTFIFQ